MLTYNMDVEERSTWLRATPGAAALAQPIRKAICCFIRCPAPV